MLDVDTAARGEAALDLGNLLAQLDHARALALGRDDSAARAGIAAAAESLAVSDDRLSSYTRAAALRLVCVHAFRPAHRDATIRWARRMLTGPASCG